MLQAISVRLIATYVVFYSLPVKEPISIRFSFPLWLDRLFK